MKKCRMVYKIHSLLTFDMTEEEKNIFEEKIKEQYGEYDRNLGL